MSVFSVEGIISLATEEAEKAIKQTGKSAESAATGIEQRFEKVGQVIKKALTITAFVAAGKALMSLANETAAYGDQVDKMSQKLGMSRKAYQEWSYILSQNGTDVSNLTTAMRTLTTTVSNGSTKTKDALKKIGIGFDDLNAMSQEDQLMAVVKGLAGMQNQSERNATAAVLLGRSYQQLLPLLNSGAESIEELRQKAHDLGIVMDDEAIDAATNYTDNLDSLNRTWKSLKMTMGAQMLKPLTKAFETLTGWVSKLIPSLKQGFATNDWNQFFGDLSDIIAQALPKFVDTVMGIINGILANADKLAELAGTIISGLIRGLGAAIPKLIAALPTILSTLWQSLSESIPAALQSILGGIGQSIAGWLGIDEGTQSDISAIFSDVFLGVDTVIGEVIGWFSGIFGSIQTILNKEGLSDGEKISAIFETVFGGVFDVASGIITAFDNILFDIAQALGLQDYYETFKGFFDTAFSGAYDIFTSVVQTFGNIFGEIGKLFNGEEDLSTFIANIFGSSEGEGSGLFGVAAKVVKTFSGLLQSIWQGIFGEGSFDGIQSFIDALFGSTDGDGSGLFGVAHAVVQTFATLFQDIAGLFNGNTSLGDLISNLFGSYDNKQGLFGVARLIVDTFSDLFNKILEKLGVSQETRDALTGAFESAFSGVFDFMEGLVETIGDMFGMVGILLGEGTWQEKVNKIGEKYFNWRDPTEKTLPENIISTALKSAQPAMNDLGRFMLGQYWEEMTGEDVDEFVLGGRANIARLLAQYGVNIYHDPNAAVLTDTQMTQDQLAASGVGSVGTWRTYIDQSDATFQQYARAYAQANANASRHGIGVDEQANQAAKQAAQQQLIDWFMQAAGVDENTADYIFKDFSKDMESTFTDWIKENNKYRYQMPVDQVFDSDWFATPASNAANALQEALDGQTYTANVTLVPTAGTADGSHATGMDYVPFDNYISRLHRGEAVLSAFEAAEWRSRGQYGASGNNSSYTDNNTLYVGQMYMSNDLDAEQLQQTLATMTRRKNRGYGLA